MILIAGATGFLGKELCQWARSNGRDVAVVGRDRTHAHKILGEEIKVFSWEELEKVGQVNAVINLAGAGIADKRWTVARKKEIIESRVNSTIAIAKFCAMRTPRPILLNASAVGIYGIQSEAEVGLPPRLDENSPIAAENADDFLSHVCRAWESATDEAKKASVRVINLRLGVILGKNGGALPKMAMPFYLGVGGPIGSGRWPVPWISLDDVIMAINFLIDRSDIAGPINLTSPGCVTQRDFAKILGWVLNRPSFLPTPGAIMQVALGEMAKELLLSGQNVFPKKLLDAGFRFQYHDLETALVKIYALKRH